MSTTYRRDFGQPLDYQQNLVHRVLKDVDKIPGSNCCNLIDSSYGNIKSNTAYPLTKSTAVTHIPKKKFDCPVESQQTTRQQQKITTKCPFPKPCTSPQLSPPNYENIQAQHMCCPQLRSTYQIEFCNLCDGEYKDDGGWMRLPSFLNQRSYKKSKDKGPKNLKENYDDANDFQQGNQKVRRVSEYVANIGRLGCVIMANKLHDHSKCNMPTNCRHTIFHFC